MAKTGTQAPDSSVQSYVHNLQARDTRASLHIPSDPAGDGSINCGTKADSVASVWGGEGDNPTPAGQIDIFQFYTDILAGSGDVYHSAEAHTVIANWEMQESVTLNHQGSFGSITDLDAGSARICRYARKVPTGKARVHVNVEAFVRASVSLNILIPTPRPRLPEREHYPIEPPATTVSLYERTTAPNVDEVMTDPGTQLGSSVTVTPTDSISILDIIWTQVSFSEIVVAGRWVILSIEQTGGSQPGAFAPWGQRSLERLQGRLGSMLQHRIEYEARIGRRDDHLIQVQFT